MYFACSTRATKAWTRSRLGMASPGTGASGACGLGKHSLQETKPMAAPRGSTLYHSPASRAFTAYWMLEELGVRFAVKTVDIRKGEQKEPAYLKLNPAGKVPTLTDGEVVVSENPAIAIYLADRYGYGTLAPKIDDPDRGPYLKWMVYSSAVVDPVATLHEQKIDLPGFNFSFGAFGHKVEVLEGELKAREYQLSA